MVTRCDKDEKKRELFAMIASPVILLTAIEITNLFEFCQTISRHDASVEDLFVDFAAFHGHQPPD